MIFEEVVRVKDFEKSVTQREACITKKESKFPRKPEDGFIYKLDELNEKEKNDARIQAVFKRFRHINLSFFHKYPRLLRTARTNYWS